MVAIICADKVSASPRREALISKGTKTRKLVPQASRFRGQGSWESLFSPHLSPPYINRDIGIIPLKIKTVSQLHRRHPPVSGLEKGVNLIPARHTLHGALEPSEDMLLMHCRSDLSELRSAWATSERSFQTCHQKEESALEFDRQKGELAVPGLQRQLTSKQLQHAPAKGPIPIIQCP
ncbi:hypothetical protein BJX65DRAFT_111576 [Aspergillus insuetus]